MKRSINDLQFLHTLTAERKIEYTNLWKDGKTRINTGNRWQK